MALAQEAPEAVSLERAIEAALQTNPDILEARFSQQAIEFERDQARGAFAPQLSVETSAGIRRLENTTRRNLRIAGDEIYPIEAGLTGEWTLLDFGRRKGELERQTARVEGASMRVLQRSEFVALQVSRQYLDLLLQQRVAAAAEDNRRFHEVLVADLGEGVAQGSISIADLQQAQERLQTAIVREEEARRALADAAIAMRSLTGLDIARGVLPPDLAAAMPPSLGMAIDQALVANPAVREAQAEVAAADALVMRAEGDLYPSVGVELRSRVGQDIDGFAGDTNDVQGRLVMRWSLFDGGVKRARVNQTVQQASAARAALDARTREAEEDVRKAWNALESQWRIVEALDRQAVVSDELLSSYRSQFNIGRRSLLDVLDAQNSRFNTRVRLETSRFSALFSRFQVLAATNSLLEALGLELGGNEPQALQQREKYGPPAPPEFQPPADRVD
jgi:adhesin transport system outer membrane protein